VVSSLFWVATCSQLRPGTFLALVAEDGWIENLTAGLFVVAGVLGLSIARQAARLR
jgi:hypothetical protein